MKAKTQRYISLFLALVFCFSLLGLSLIHI